MTGKGCKPAVYWLNAFVLDAAESDMPLGIQYGLRSRDGAENRALKNPDVTVAFPSDADGNLRGTIYRMAPRHLNPNDQ